MSSRICLHFLFQAQKFNSDLVPALEEGYQEVESVKLGGKQSTKQTRTEKMS